jgi:hypothetical protein
VGEKIVFAMQAAAICGADSGGIRPLMMIKEVGNPHYGGAYLEIVNGQWQRLDLIPGPKAHIVAE